MKLDGVTSIIGILISIIVAVLGIVFGSGEGSSGPVTGSSSSAAGPVTVSQGMGITSPQGMSFLWQKNIECTIGYVDGPRKVAYTARHCAQEGDPTDTNYIGVEIRTSDGRRIGETVHPQKYQGRTPYLSYTAKESDLVAIALDDDVIAGANVYSGDSIVDYSYLSPGTRVCTYGRVAKATRCGTISHLHDDAFVRTVRTAESGGRWSVTGDSGGPVWLENGGGFVGIHNGSYLVDGVYKGTFFTGF